MPFNGSGERISPQMRDETFAIEYLPLRDCPACGAEPISYPDWKPIALDQYYWGTLRIPAYQGGKHVAVRECPSCGLCFKNLAASAESLKELFSRISDIAWQSRYSYASEVGILQKHFSGQRIGVLEVGAGQGGFLRAVASHASRLSALDIVRFPECEQLLRGEYIVGLLDDDHLEWSGEPYDLVAMFDVAEHLYDVRQGFKNLYQLVRPGGLVLLETGNAHSSWPRRFGPERWWYLNLLEHHVAFNSETLRRVAKSAGFEVISIRMKRHKEHTVMSPSRLWKDLVKSFLYRLMPSDYPRAMARLGFATIQPMPPFSRDHLQAILRRP